MQMWISLISFNFTYISLVVVIGLSVNVLLLLRGANVKAPWQLISWLVHLEHVCFSYHWNLVVLLILMIFLDNLLIMFSVQKTTICITCNSNRKAKRTRETIHVCYGLLPYYYMLFRESNLSATPIIYPLLMNLSSDEKTFSNDEVIWLEVVC